MTKILQEEDKTESFQLYTKAVIIITVIKSCGLEEAQSLLLSSGLTQLGAESMSYDNKLKIASAIGKLITKIENEEKKSQLSVPS